MAGWLRTLGAVVLGIGFVIAAVAFWLVAADAEFREVAAAYARHPDHALFRTEYLTAAARHYGLLLTGAGGVLGGLVFGSLLFALAELLRRLPPRA